MESPLLEELIALLDEAASITATTGCCQGVKDALEKIVASGNDFIDPHFLVPDATKYARRLLHKDPLGRYAAMVMVWDVGQGTALHDHAGMWCVECVYRGRIKVVSYSMQGNEGDEYRFSPEKVVYAGPGEAGALIPPFDYHTMENAMDVPAITLHVYGGEMKWCNAFLPNENGYKLERRELSYTA